MPTKASKNPMAVSAVGRNIIIDKLNLLIGLLRDRHARHYRDSHFHFWADLLLAGALVGSAVILVWLLFWQPQADFVLEPRALNARVVSGQAEEFIIHYENKEENLIRGASIVLGLPKHMALISASGALFDKDAAVFTLGDLSEGASGEVSFTALVRGEIGARQFIACTLTYQEAQIKKQVLASIVYHIDASALELGLELPDSTYRNIPFNGAFDLKNSSAVKLENVAVSFTPLEWEINPDGYVLEQGRIVIPALEAGETKHIGFAATPTTVGENQSFNAKTYLIIGEEVLAQSSNEKKLSVIEPSLALSSSFKQETFSESPVDLNVTLKNNDDSPISNISLAVESQRSSISVSGVTSSASSVNASNNAISISSIIDSGAQVKVPLQISLDRHETVFNDVLSLGLRVSYEMDGKKFEYVVAAPKLKVDSNLSVSSAGYYYGPQGDQLGIGPLPPQVDIPTTYWVIWEANNLGNDLTDFEVSAEVPANVVWIEQQSLVAGEISYSPVTRRVLWKVPSIPRNGGNFRASFAVSLVPRNEDIGSVPDLLRNIEFRAKDMYSQAQISKKLANITTNIEKDRQAAGKGKVEKQQ